MFDFLSRGKHKTDTAAPDHGPATAPQTVHLSATQLEMVRMTLHGVLKLNGIPGTWIAGEVVPVHIPGLGEALLLQLEVMHWHDALVLHAPAFQQAMLDGLKRFDPNADRTRYLFAWKFSPQCGCPHVHLPEPGYWAASERVVLAPIAPPLVEPPLHAAAPMASAAMNKHRFDLPDADNESDDDHGFAPTQIHEAR